MVSSWRSCGYNNGASCRSIGERLAFVQFKEYTRDSKRLILLGGMSEFFDLDHIGKTDRNLLFLLPIALRKMRCLLVMTLFIIVFTSNVIGNTIRGDVSNLIIIFLNRFRSTKYGCICIAVVHGFREYSLDRFVNFEYALCNQFQSDSDESSC